MPAPTKAMTQVAAATPLLRVVLRFCAIYCFIALFGSNLDRAAARQGGLTPAGLTPAAEDGPCSLARAFPAIVALVDEDFDLLLDDGRRVALAGLEFPSSGGQAKTIREAAFSRLSNWLAGEQNLFIPSRLGARSVGPRARAGDRRRGFLADAPLVFVGAALLAEGLARFRLRIPTKPAMHSNLKSATYSDLKPATVPI